MDKKIVTLQLTTDDAERFMNGLSDLLCIVRGIEIAKPKLAKKFMGVSETQDLNMKLKSAINKASE